MGRYLDLLVHDIEPMAPEYKERARSDNSAKTPIRSLLSLLARPEHSAITPDNSPEASPLSEHLVSAKDRAFAVNAVSEDEHAGIVRSEGMVPRVGIPELPDEPILLRDGRRLWRFPADAIPEHAPGTIVELVKKAQWHDTVLVADGLELVVVERWLSRLPPSALQELRDRAGEVIAALRLESRIRCAGREHAFEPTCRNSTDER